jgi:hypothetical protein
MRLLAKTAGNHPQDQLQPQRFQHVTAERTLTSLDRFEETLSRPHRGREPF